MLVGRRLEARLLVGRLVLRVLLVLVSWREVLLLVLLVLLLARAQMGALQQPIIGRLLVLIVIGCVVVVVLLVAERLRVLVLLLVLLVLLVFVLLLLAIESARAVACGRWTLARRAIGRVFAGGRRRLGAGQLVALLVLVLVLMLVLRVVLVLRVLVLVQRRVLVLLLLVGGGGHGGRLLVHGRGEKRGRMVMVVGDLGLCIGGRRHTGRLALGHRLGGLSEPLKIELVRVSFAMHLLHDIFVIIITQRST